MDVHIVIRITSVASEREIQALRLLREYREQGDLRAHEQLVRLYLPLVRALAHRHGHRGEQLDDVVQIGAIGLLNAIDRFDADKGGFEAFAVPTVVGELRRHYRDRGWPVRVPRRLQELRRALDDTGAELAGRFARTPTPGELARAIGAPERDVLSAFEAERLRTPVSLSAPSPHEHAELLSFEAHAADDATERCDQRLLIASGLRRLDRRARHIVHLRFFEGLSQAQIARELQLSQIHVSRLLREALGTLRRHIAPV
jgi:RNA polymerase sigma-B factor